MQSALHIDEIISQILHELAKKSDRLSMALTCKVFQEPAIVALWSSLENLTPLVELLHIGEPGMDGSDQSSPFTQVNWSRWSMYDRHVREITSVQIRGITSALLSTAPSLGDLLPCLRKATIESSPKYHPLLIRLVSGPNLRDLSYSCTEKYNPTKHATFFADHCLFLTNHMPSSLTALDVSELQLSVRQVGPTQDPGDSAERLRSIVHVIGAQKCLQRLKIYNILDSPFDLLYEVAQLPQLSSLDTRIWKPREMAEGSTHIVSFTLPPRSFPSLSDLSVRIHSSLLNQLNAILLPHCSSLRRLTLAYIWNSGAPLLPEILMGLTQLEVLDMTVIDNVAILLPAWLALGHEDLNILTSLGNLRRVSLSLPEYAGPGSEIFQHLAQAWPKLEALTIRQASGGSPFPLYSPGDLAAFARHCPNLMFLEVPAFKHPQMPVGGDSVQALEPITNITTRGMRRVIFRCPRSAPRNLLFKSSSDILQFWPNAVVEILDLYHKSIPMPYY